MSRPTRLKPDRRTGVVFAWGVRATAWIALAAAACSAPGQNWKADPGATDESLKPGPGEITVDQAVEAGRAFFRKIGVAIPSDAPTAKRFTWNKKPGGSVSLTY